MTEKTLMRVLIAFAVVIVGATMIVGIVVRRRHHSHGDPGDANHTVRERHFRRSYSRSGHRRPRDPMETAFEAHMDRVKSFRCSDPVPEALSVLSVQSWRPATHEVFQPEYTVLHRCGDASGCCHNHELTCQGAEMKEVALVLSVQDNDTGRKHFEEVTATNHTRCECREKSLELPK